MRILTLTKIQKLIQPIVQIPIIKTKTLTTMIIDGKETTLVVTITLVKITAIFVLLMLVANRQNAIDVNWDSSCYNGKMADRNV
jgi:hypothetical protein